MKGFSHKLSFFICKMSMQSRRFLWIHDHVADVSVRGPCNIIQRRIWNLLLDALQSDPICYRKLQRLVAHMGQPDETRLFFSFVHWTLSDS